VVLSGAANDWRRMYGSERTSRSRVNDGLMVGARRWDVDLRAAAEAVEDGAPATGR